MTGFHNKWNRGAKRASGVNRGLRSLRRGLLVSALILTAAILLAGCSPAKNAGENTAAGAEDDKDRIAGAAEKPEQQTEEPAQKVEEEPAQQTEEPVQQTEESAQLAEETTGLAHETAADGGIDFNVLQAENPDIFAWLYIPGTRIDGPVLQSMEADDYYESHDAFGKENAQGAFYIELANQTNMCDFNTVIHGKTDGDGGMFSDLHLFADADFFGKQHELYVYLPDNVLTYEIFTAYQREDASLIRDYDFSYLSGCQEFLKDMYGVREMGRNFRDGWGDLTPYHFLLTLTTNNLEQNGKQYVVLAAMTQDAAGTIEGAVFE